MKQLLITTATASILFGVAGCKSTPKNDTANQPNSRANETVLEHMGNDIGTVGKGAADAVGGTIEAVGGAIGGVLGGDDKDKDKDKTDTE